MKRHWIAQHVAGGRVFVVKCWWWWPFPPLMTFFFRVGGPYETREAAQEAAQEREARDGN